VKVYIHGLNSCGMRNTVIQSYRDFLIANGHEIVGRMADSDKVLVWTCGFRKDVRDNSIAEIGRLEKEYQGELLVAGCLPDIDRDLLRKNFSGKIIPWREDGVEMERVFGAPKKKLSEIPLVLFKKQLYEDEEVFRKNNPGADVPYIGRYTQVYISEGCRWECTYCSERLTFPPYRSFPEDHIVETCRREWEVSAKKGVVLLGDSVGDYGIDTGSSLPKLLRRLQTTIPGITIALQDFNPFHFMKFYDDMVSFIRASLIVHLQMPYQSASDHILNLMKRPYTRDLLNMVFGTLNDLGFRELDSHMIVGFPGEREEDFEESVQFALRYRPKYMLINGFMEAPGMVAAALPDKVTAETKQRRMEEAEKRFKAVGMMCNRDNSDLANERFRKMDQCRL